MIDSFQNSPNMFLGSAGHSFWQYFFEYGTNISVCNSLDQVVDQKIVIINIHPGLGWCERGESCFL